VAQAQEEEEPNLGLCTEGSSPGWARGGGELDGKKSSGEGSEWCSSVRKKRPMRYPRARWCSGSRRRGRRWSVGGWRRGGGHRRGRQSAAGEKKITLARGVEEIEFSSPLDRSSVR
jgi:hypothetical protein